MTTTPSAAAPVLAPEPGWVAISPFPPPVARSRFVSGDPTGDRYRVAFFRREGTEGLVGKAWFGPGTEGPPGHAHGGSVAALLDEAMGAAAWSSGLQVLAGRLTTHFRNLLPLHSVVHFESHVVTVDERKVFTRGRLLDSKGETYAEAEGLFVRLSEAQLQQLAEVLEAK